MAHSGRLGVALRGPRLPGMTGALVTPAKAGANAEFRILKFKIQVRAYDVYKRSTIKMQLSIATS